MRSSTLEQPLRPTRETPVLYRGPSNALYSYLGTCLAFPWPHHRSISATWIARPQCSQCWRWPQVFIAFLRTGFSTVKYSLCNSLLKRQLGLLVTCPSSTPKLPRSCFSIFCAGAGSKQLHSDVQSKRTQRRTGGRKGNQVKAVPTKAQFKSETQKQLGVPIRVFCSCLGGGGVRSPKRAPETQTSRPQAFRGKGQNTWAVCL